jgi:hypothetical protein
MFKNILNQNQVDLLPLVQSFSKEFYLVGGTAIALQIGHRKSIDFDLFSGTSINRERIKKKIVASGHDFQVIFEDADQLHGVINNVRLTFYEYPYPIQTEVQFEDVVKMPSLLTLAAMKAFALGKRAKWKDYVDMYFLLKEHFTLDQIAAHAEQIFGGMFNAKLLRQQLTYYQDVNYSEVVEYVIPSVSNEEVENFLTAVATETI